MRSKQEVLKDLLVTLGELEFGVKEKSLEDYLKIRLKVLYEIVEEDVPERYWERIDNIITIV